MSGYLSSSDHEGDMRCHRCGQVFSLEVDPGDDDPWDPAPPDLRPGEGLVTVTWAGLVLLLMGLFCGGVLLAFLLPLAAACIFAFYYLRDWVFVRPRKDGMGRGDCPRCGAGNTVWPWSI